MHDSHASEERSVPAMHAREPRWVFFGPEGLRAGWSLLLFVVFVLLMSKAAGFVLHALIHTGGRVGPQSPEWLSVAGSAIMFVVVAVPAWIVSCIERRPWGEYGIPSLRGRAGEFGHGILWGFGLLSVLVFVLWAIHDMSFAGLWLHGPGQELLWAVLYGISFLFTGFFEEFAFRGFVQFTLTRGIAGILRSLGLEHHARAIGFWITALLLGFLFGFAHRSNHGEAALGLVAAGLIGVLFAFSLWRTGSLWWAIGFHAAWDWAESYFYGTADSGGVSSHRLLLTTPHGNPLWSGGNVGPEGSLLILPTILLIAVVAAVTLKPRPGSPASELDSGEWDHTVPAESCAR